MRCDRGACEGLKYTAHIHTTRSIGHALFRHWHYSALRYSQGHLYETRARRMTTLKIKNKECCFGLLCLLRSTAVQTTGALWFIGQLYGVDTRYGGSQITYKTHWYFGLKEKGAVCKHKRKKREEEHLASGPTDPSVWADTVQTG